MDVRDVIAWVLAGVNVWLLLRHFHLVRQLARVNDILAKISGGNYNLRFRVPTTNPLMKRLSANLNGLVDQFQQTLKRIHYLEHARKKMLAYLSHDLRTPLAAMLGYVEVLRTDHSLTPEERAEYLGIVFQRGTKLAEMLKDFFEFARLQAEESPLSLEPVDLAEKAREALLLVYPEATRVGVVAKVEIPERPVWAWANARAVDRVLHNLLVNALRHGKDGGVVGVAVREENDRVWVDVWDGGKGIEKQDLPYIFDPFYTGTRSRDAGRQGSGLGLAIVKHLVEKQQGTVTVSSVPGKRTTVSFALRRVVEDALPLRGKVRNL